MFILFGDKFSCCALIDAMKKTCYIKKAKQFDYISIGGDSVRSYVYETVKLSNTKRIVTRYTPSEALFISIIKLLAYLLIVWPFEIFVWWPVKVVFKYTLVLCELLLRCLWWLIRLPLFILAKKKMPSF